MSHVFKYQPTCIPGYIYMYYIFVHVLNKIVCLYIYMHFVTGVKRPLACSTKQATKMYISVHAHP